MRSPICSDFNAVEMSTHISNQDASNESRIEKMKKFLSSPLTRKKPSGSQTKTFGTSLDILIQRTPSEAPVPYIVTRICQYIEDTGLLHEGLFRISGNARLIERLKLCFDQTGDAPLETEGDVASAAALLKLFLRELPDPIIPLSMHQQFLNAVKETDKDESISHLMHLVEKIPFPNFSLLKYLSYFLMQVSQFEEQNRMSASSLGIVFGPNLFRVADDFIGLKEQSLTNQIVTYFITDYYAIFHSEPEHLGKSSSRLATSFDSAVKHNHISLDANHSMVSSWPKLSSFPSLMSSLNLRPLSVSIPVTEGYTANTDTECVNSEEHILMVDESHSEDSHTRANEQVSDQSEKEESKGNNSMRRKRKERKLVKEDVLASYSTVQDVSHSILSRADDAAYIEATNLHSFSMDSKAVVKTPQNLHLTEDDTSTFQPVSYFPKQRLQEVENLSTEPLLDPQKSVQAFRIGIDLSTHEAQRSVERTTLHVSPQRNRSSPKSVPTYAKTNLDVLTDLKPDVPTDFECNMIDGAHSTSYTSNVSGHTDIAKELISPANVSELATSPLVECPVDEQRFSYDHKHHRRGKSHRSHYYKKQQAYSESKRTAPMVQDLSAEKKELQLEGLKSSLESDEDLGSLNATITTTEKNVSTDAASNESSASNSDQRYSWPILKWLQDGDQTTASPANQFLKISSSTEAPLSPSAYRSYLSHRSPHLDPNLPPSPPVEQEDLATGVVDDVNKATVKQLSKKIQSTKKKIKQFEENFEATHGYRPSYAEKSYYPDIKKLIMDLNEARQELKQLKEEPAIPDSMLPQHWSPSEDDVPAAIQKTNKGTNTCRFGACLGPVLTDGVTVTIEESLAEALKYLEVKRKSSQRPDALEDMTREQLVEEKFTIQKLLLQFESIHGRPSSKTHRDLMRPLYDRYRNAKRILARSTSFGSLTKGKDSVELPPILEHETMDFRSSEVKNSLVGSEAGDSVNIIEKSENEMDKEINEDQSLKPNLPVENHCKLKDALGTVLKTHANFHELSLPELFDQQQHARAEKRRLRSILREFEAQFHKDHGRKVQREDKVEMEDVYGAYKNVRARLKLLEALAKKHGHKK